MSAVTSPVDLKVADEVWIIAALLQKDHPEKADFSVEEIMDRAQREKLTNPLRPGVYVHVIQHCVANRAPNPGRYRMLFETSSGRRRLFRHGDIYHPAREGGKITPSPENMPLRFCKLLDWYREWSTKAVRAPADQDPLLQLRGSGRRLWASEHADEYVRRLREGWE
ncbi:MAG: hypothetical protein ACLPPV_17090 [Candidatus Korobacteraceae bacterium]|jgi:hypothetical protein